MKVRKFNEMIEMPGVRGNKVEGWINIKIDRDLPIRVSRYAKALDQYVSATDLEAKLDILSKPIQSQMTYGPQCQLSIVILLQYLKEIKNNFESSSAGFLFEDYIAGLLHRKRKGGYSKTDFVGIGQYGQKEHYQIKFYRYQTGKITLRGKMCDKYVIGLKGAETAFIWIIGGEGEFQINDCLIPIEGKIDEYQIDLIPAVDILS